MESQPQNPEFRINPDNFDLGMQWKLLTETFSRSACPQQLFSLRNKTMHEDIASFRTKRR